MEWIVEFEGRQLPTDAVWNDVFARIVGPLKSTTEKSLNRAPAPDELEGLKIVVFADNEGGGPTWGVKFAGPQTAVNYAVSLLGEQAPIVPPTH